ncbi:MAG TPA: tetratricopeptide repeat protein [Polyangiaceae bacterium]|nr:tetratricopeptide repeat protein [Polyangiaceae bacterium]
MNSFGKGFALVAGLSLVVLQGQAFGQATKAAAPKPAAPAAGAPAAAASGAAAAPAGGECISAQANAAFSTCPTNGPTMLGESGKGPKAQFHSAPPPQDLKKRDQQTKPNNPQESLPIAQRDERRNRLQARVRAMLVTEIQGMESLFASTPKASPDRQQLCRRLAEDYVELEAAAFRDKTEAGVKAEEAKKNNPPAAAKLLETVKQGSSIMVAARKKAIDYYTLLKNGYPNYSQMDEVLYYLAYEYEQGQDYPNARKVYYELIQKAPQSKYIPNAYLAFGELFFNEAQGDPSKWDLAAGAYSEVIKYPPPNNKVYGYAHYKLAYVYWNKGEFPRALDEFKKTIDYGTQFATVPNAAQLAVAARRDLVPVYALAGRPDAAYNFFKNLSGDAGAENTKTLKMMDDLGTNYLDTGHYPEAIALYHDLMGRDRGDSFCRYQSHVTQATMAMKSGNKEQIKTELDRQVEVYSTFAKTKHSDEAQAQCANRTAELVAETAMAWHLEAVGSGGVRGTMDQKTMSLAGYLYKKVIDNFTTADFAKFEFPRIVKEDWPTIYKIKYEMADLLYFQQRWAECGPAFDAVVAENPTSAEAPEAAYAAVLCYQNIYQAQHADKSDRKGSGNMPGDEKTAKGKKGKGDDAAQFKPKELTTNQQGMITAFNRYVCYIKPKEGDKQAFDQFVEVKYARARTYFEAQHWEEAALGFRDVAVTYPDKDVGIYAAQLYLESLNVLGTHSDPPKPGCFESMAQDVPLFIKLYCEGPNFQKNQEQCTSLNKIQCDIHRLKAEKTVELADRGGAQALRLYEQAGNDYIQIWRTYGDEPLKAKQPVLCEKLEAVVYNAAKAFAAGRLIAKAIQARLILINPANNMDKTDLAKKAVYEIGLNYQAIAVYDESANWYEKYAKENPKGENADKALSDATLLRLGLGQEEEAIKDGDAYNKAFGNSKAATSAAIGFAIGAHYAEAENWDKAKTRLSGAMGLIEKSATFDVVVQAHGLLARTYASLKRAKDARVEYGKVQKLWSDAKAAEGKIMALPDEDEAGKVRRLGRALTAVGEAYFYFAEEKREDVEKIKFPDYKGPGNKEAVLKHIKGPVIDWMKKKRPAIEAAQAEYIKIVQLQPVPPPRWVIAAGSQVGGLWGNFVREFRAAPIPTEIKKDTELRNAYYGALDEASEPDKLKAKGAFETCLGYSVKYQFFDEYSRRCEVWLSKTYKNEYHAIDEFRASPVNIGSGLNDRPYPLQIGGDVYNEAPPPPPPLPVDKSKEKDDDKADKPKKGGGGGKPKAGGPAPGKSRSNLPGAKKK